MAAGYEWVARLIKRAQCGCNLSSIYARWANARFCFRRWHYSALADRLNRDYRTLNVSIVGERIAAYDHHRTIRRHRDRGGAGWGAAGDGVRAGREADGDYRAGTCGRDVHQRGMHADEDDGGERAG